MDPLTAGLLAGSAALSAGGPIASGLLANDPKDRTATQLQSSNLLNQVASLQLLSRLGFSALSPELLLQASPIQQALNRRFATPVSRESRRRLLKSQQLAVEAVMAARESGDTRDPNEIIASVLGGQQLQALQRLAADGGFTSPAELVNAELAFRDQIPSVLQTAQGEAAQSRALREASMREQLAALDDLGQGADVGAIREQELTRLLRDIELQRPNVLAQASAGGFNPGRQLEALERMREDAGLTALQRAISLASGQTEIARLRGATAQGLDPTLLALGVSPNFGGTTSTQTAASQPNNAAAAGIGAGAASGGQSLGNIALLQLLAGGGRGPAAGAGGGSGSILNNVLTALNVGG